MDSSIDHHCFLLDLPNDSSKLSLKQITRAYKLKALALHPDKRPNDSNAQGNFHKLKTSYEFLKNHILLQQQHCTTTSTTTTTGDHDDHINRGGSTSGIKHNRQQYDDDSDHSKKRRRKMVSDLEKRERVAAAAAKEAKAREEERIHLQLKAEMARIRANLAAAAVQRKAAAEIKKPSNYIINHGGTASAACTSSTSTSTVGLDMERMLTVSWEMIGRDYSVQRLKQVFEGFGKVEDVMVSAKERDLAVVVMASKDAALAATRSVCGDLSNPLLVMPFTSASVNRFSYLDGLRYQEHEDLVLTKLKNFKK